MAHVLVITDNMVVSKAIECYLKPLGFDTFAHTWTEEQALRAAHCHRPDLVVIGDYVEDGSPVIAAERIAAEGTIPVLMVTGDPVRAERELAGRASFKGPFLLNQIEEAVDLARVPSRPRALEHATA